VAGKLYIGRTAAGGEGDSVYLNGDGKAEVIFSEPCGFIFLLDKGRVTAAEADREDTMRIQGKLLRLSAYTLVTIER
jgi:hypothetical protein